MSTCGTRLEMRRRDHDETAELVISRCAAMGDNLSSKGCDGASRADVHAVCGKAWLHLLIWPRPPSSPPCWPSPWAMRPAPSRGSRGWSTRGSAAASDRDGGRDVLRRGRHVDEKGQEGVHLALGDVRGTQATASHMRPSRGPRTRLAVSSLPVRNRLSDIAKLISGRYLCCC